MIMYRFSSHSIFSSSSFTIKKTVEYAMHNLIIICRWCDVWWRKRRNIWNVSDAKEFHEWLEVNGMSENSKRKKVWTHKFIKIFLLYFSFLFMIFNFIILFFCYKLRNKGPHLQIKWTIFLMLNYFARKHIQ